MAELPGVEPRAGAMLDLTSPDYVIELTELEGRLHVLRGLLDVSSRFPELNETIQYAHDRETALDALQREPFGYSYQQAEAILNMPMGWQSAAEVDQLRDERDRLASRRLTLQENATEELDFHWFG